MTLAGLAIKRPVATTMFMISMIFLGFVALFTLKTELLPNMNIPLIMIETTWDGAVPEDIESQITKKIEDVLPNIEGITKIRSSSSFGRSSVIAELDFGSDIDAKKGEIQTEIDAIKADLPGTASEPSIKKLQAGRGVSTMQLILSGPNIPELSTFVEEYVKPRFERIQGVGGLDISGVAAKQIQIQFDTNKLSGYNLTPTELYGLIQQSSVNLPLGTINTGGKEVVARFVGEFSQIDEFKNMIIKSGGKTLRLIDVAEVVLTTEDISSLAKRNGEYGIAIGVNKTTSGNTLDINKVVKKNIEELKLYAPAGVSFNIIFDATENIESSINGVKNNGFSGLILATIVLLIFLKNLRATLLITFALPISIMFTFVFLYFQGITLNLISLMGLSIGVGMLTDNSVVVIDNIYRHISELKKTVRDASDDGATEVSIAIIASASTTMVVFIPILFIPGFAREIFKDLAYAIIYSNLAAIIVSLTLMPMVASRFLNPNINVASEGKIFIKFKEKYKKLLELAFNNKNKTVLIAIVTFIVVITGGVKIVKTEFFPNQDTGKYSIVAELPKGVSIETAEAISEKLEKIAKENEHTKSYTTLLDKQKVIVNIDIGPKSDRKISIFDLQKEIRPLAEKTLDVKSTIANEFQTDTPGKDVQFRVTGDNLDEITQVAIKIKEAITGKKGLVDVSTTAEAGNTEVRIMMDREKLNSYGITPAELGETISYSLLGGNRGQGKTITVKTGTEEIDVLIRMSDEDRRKISTLEQINIKTADGNFVKVSDVAKLVMAEGKSEIEKSDKIYYISIDVNDGGVGVNNVKSVLVDEFNKVEKSKTVSYQWGGQTELMDDVTVQMGMALLISIFLIYAILASQFENFTLPFIIIGSIPLALIGVYIGLILTNKPFNMMVMIGIIMLAGTVVNNAIVLIDYIEILRVRGAEREVAIKEACVTRLRPILMTTMTTVLGMIPMALGIGEGAEIYSGMAITVMFGLSFSTLLTLVVIPILYSQVEDFNNKILSLVSKSKSKTS